MSARSAGAVLDSPLPRPRPRARPKARARAARHAKRAKAPMFGGVLSIVIVTVLLTGVVALNVAVLRLTVELDRLGRERTELRAENAVLAARVSKARATGRIRNLADRRLGLVTADPDQMTFVELSPAER